MLFPTLLLFAAVLNQVRCISSLNDCDDVSGNENIKSRNPKKRQQQQQQQRKPQVLLLSFDGFRWDYLSDKFTSKFSLTLPNFDKLKVRFNWSNSVSASKYG